MWVRADQTKISRVIYNFICNAINHTGQDKKIRVQQLVQDKKVFVRVTDNGPGIAEDKISSIWDRYYRIEQGNRTSAAEGSGLGLCIVKNILQQHQAEYGVESKQNQGSTFWFALEVLDQQQTEKFVKKTKPVKKATDYQNRWLLLVILVQKVFAAVHGAAICWIGDERQRK